MLNRGRTEQGFGLIELIVAVSLLAVVIGSVAYASIASSNASITSQGRVKIAAALEQAVERVQLERPWIPAQRRCTRTQANGSCTYTFLVSSTDRFDFRSTVSITPIGEPETTSAGTTPTAYDIAVTVTAFERGTNTVFQQLRPLKTSFVHDLRRTETGDVIVASCRVEQADERSAAGTCPRVQTTYDMEPPHAMPRAEQRDKVGNSWMLPPWVAYGRTPDTVSWNEAIADGKDHMVYRPNTFSATVRLDGRVVASAAAATGQHQFTGLKRGTYEVEVRETNDVSDEWDFWSTKSTGHRPDPDRPRVYRVVVTPGTQARITRLWEPEPVEVRIRVKTGDSSVGWAPNWLYQSVPDHDSHQRAMLIPFPEGRTTIPGLTDKEWRDCPTHTRNTEARVCDQDWGILRANERWVTMRVRPGLYQASWYQSARSEGEWAFKKRVMAKADLGFSGARWRQTLAEHGRIGYVYVNRNGTLGSAQRATDSNVGMRYPGCWGGRRMALTRLFNVVSRDPTEYGDTRWVYHDSQGRIQPRSLWNSLPAGLRSELTQYNAPYNLGWMRLVNETGRGDNHMSYYHAARGGWDDVIQEYRVSRFIRWDYYWDADARVTRRRAVHGPWSDWSRTRPTRRHAEDRIQSRADEVSGDYRVPLNENILYRNVGRAGLGYAQFAMADACDSPNIELDGDGNSYS